MRPYRCTPHSLQAWRWMVAFESTIASLSAFATTCSRSRGTTATCANSAPFGFQHFVQPQTWLCADCPLICTSTLLREQLHHSDPPAKSIAAGLIPLSTAGCIARAMTSSPIRRESRREHLAPGATAIAMAHKGRVARRPCTVPFWDRSARRASLLVQVLREPAHAAQPRLVGIAPDVHRAAVAGSARFAAHFDVDVEDEVAHLLDPAARHIARARRHAAALELSCELGAGERQPSLILALHLRARVLAHVVDQGALGTRGATDECRGGGERRERGLVGP